MQSRTRGIINIFLSELEKKQSDIGDCTMGTSLVGTLNPNIYHPRSLSWTKTKNYKLNFAKFDHQDGFCQAVRCLFQCLESKD